MLTFPVPRTHKSQPEITQDCQDKKILGHFQEALLTLDSKTAQSNNKDNKAISDTFFPVAIVLVKDEPRALQFPKNLYH